MTLYNEKGPVYGIRLIHSLPVGTGTMIQTMPSRSDLEKTADVSERTAAGYEILLSKYRQQREEISRLTALIRSVIDGKWSVTDLQEAIGDV